MINDHLRQIREFEAGEVIPWLPKAGRLLEIGAGAGWQAARFAKAGLRVYAIELADSKYLPHTRFPTILYDGSAIPFADGSFDVIFSSNVLEHVPDVERFQQEIIRLLKPGGRIIQILPTSAWRMATNVAHYVYAARWLISRLRSFGSSQLTEHGTAQPQQRFHARAVFPARHGERGNWITELYYFSERRWRHLFRRAGLEIQATRPMGLFYTGYSVADAAISLETRRYLSKIFGSACRLYVLRRRLDGLNGEP